MCFVSQIAAHCQHKVLYETLTQMLTQLLRFPFGIEKKPR